MLTQSIAWQAFIYLVVKQRFCTRSKWHCYSTTPFKLWSSYWSWNTNNEKQLWIKQQKSKIASNFLLLCCLIDARMMIKTPFRYLDGILRFCATKSDFLSSSTEAAWYWFGSMLQNFHGNLPQLQRSCSVFVSHVLTILSFSPSLLN